MFKLLQLLSLLLKRPLEFYDRVLTILDVHSERLWVRPGIYEPLEWQEVITRIEKHINGKKVRAFLNEPACVSIEEEVHRRVEKIRPQAPFSLTHNADFTLARLCYAVCRAIEPSIVLYQLLI